MLVGSTYIEEGAYDGQDDDGEYRYHDTMQQSVTLQGRTRRLDRRTNQAYALRALKNGFMINAIEVEDAVVLLGWGSSESLGKYGRSLVPKRMRYVIQGYGKRMVYWIRSFG